MTSNNDLISRSALQKHILNMTGMFTDELGLALSFYAVSSSIKAAPVVDAVEVVRCKNCKYWGRSPFSNSTAIGWCKLAGGHLRPDFYCASGVKKA